MKSRDIGDYIQAKLTEIRPGEAVPFDLFLYFARNRHIMTWRRNGDFITDGFLDKYRSRGMDTVWVHRSDIETYYKYLNPEKFNQPAETQSVAEFPVEAPSADAASEQSEPAPVTEPETAPPVPPDTAPTKFRTVSGENIVDVLNSKSLDDKQKTAIVAKSARAVLGAAAAAPDAEAQKQATQKARDVVQDVLDHAVKRAHKVATEIWKLANVDPELEHSVNVATYAVIFAMAFGRIDRTLISDIALAGLLHDIGISQIPLDAAATAWSEQSPQMRSQYVPHVQASLDLIDHYAKDVPARVRAIVFQHHEKFDGTGYPKRLQGFKMDDVAQLLAIADLLDSIASGQWDGKPRTLRDTFMKLESLEKARTFPEHFNPEVFAAAMRWIRNYTSMESAENALGIVETQVRNLVTQTRI